MKKYTEEFINSTLKSIVASSNSYADVCRQLNIRPGGGNQSYIKSIITDNNFDTSHFLGYSWAKGTSHKNRNYDYLRDEYSGFRIFLSKAKARSLVSCDITLDDLKNQWILQNGKCTYSNVDLVLPTKENKTKNRLYTASLDRVNSKLGYNKDNIHFISVACNFAKNNMSHEQMLEFCRIIRCS
jgi:hypothetical protein